jgi:hypothetical protein
MEILFNCPRLSRGNLAITLQKDVLWMAYCPGEVPQHPSLILLARHGGLRFRLKRGMFRYTANSLPQTVGAGAFSAWTLTNWICGLYCTTNQKNSL